MSFIVFQIELSKLVPQSFVDCVAFPISSLFFFSSAQKATRVDPIKSWVQPSSSILDSILNNKIRVCFICGACWGQRFCCVLFFLVEPRSTTIDGERFGQLTLKSDKFQVTIMLYKTILRQISDDWAFIGLQSSLQTPGCKVRFKHSTEVNKRLLPRLFRLTRMNESQ